MLTESQREYIRRATLTMQIIAGALAGGAVMFFGIVLFIAAGNRPAADASPIIIYTAIGFAALAVVNWLIVPGKVAARMRESILRGDAKQWGLVQGTPDAAELGDVLPLTAIYQTRMIISLAILEGATFCACIAYMIERQTVALGLVVALLLLMLAQFPTVSRIATWTETELANIKNLKQLG